MEKRNAMVAGASGLVGMQLVRQLLDDENYQKVVVVVRRPLDLSHQKLQQLVIDFDKLESLDVECTIDDVFCALGTTIKTAGSQQAFRKVDLEYVVKLLNWCEKNSVKRFMVVSAMGAKAGSAIFYNRVKGEMETAVSRSSVDERHIFRPSLLMGQRNEKRAGEKLAQVIMQFLGFLFVGKLLKYKGIEGSRVAASMINAARQPAPGCTIHDSDEMQRTA